MDTAKKIYESDDAGVVHVDVPVGRPHRRVEVEVEVVCPDLVGVSGPDEDDEGPGMSEFVGLLEGVELGRPPQGDYETRDPLG